MGGTTILSPDDIKLIPRILRIFEEQGVPVWLSHGTLLGIIRDKQLISWDNDIDLAACGIEVFRKFSLLVGGLESQGCQVEYHFNYLSLQFPDRVAPPIAVELNWVAGSDRVLYLGGAMDHRSLPIYIAILEWVLIGPLIRFLELPVRPKKYWGPGKKALWFSLRIPHKLLFNGTFLSWFSKLGLHAFARSPYFLPVGFVFPLELIENEEAGFLPVPRNSQAILKTIYGDNWNMPDPNFDKATAYGRLRG